MKCNVCRQDVKEFDKQSKSHLVISKDNEGHVHVHGDIQDKVNTKEMIDAAAQEVGVVLGGEGTKMPGEIVLHNRQRIGDMLVFTCAVRDFKAAFPGVRFNVISTAAHIFDHNPNVDRTLVPTPANTFKIGPSKLTNSSNRIDWHFTNAFRMSCEDLFKVHIPQGESRPDIYFTQEEYDAPRLFRDPYWIISTSGEKGWGCKMYPHSKWQEFVDQNSDIIFVQIGTSEDNAPRLTGKNVIDHIGKTQSKDQGIRDLFKLFLNAEGSIGLVSFHMHLSGALHKPAIIIAGGREPVSFTRYPGHAYLSTDGMLPCSVKACWHCDINACTNLVDRGEKVPKCVDIIDPGNITRALRQYYYGERLSYDKPSSKPAMKGHIVPTPPKAVANPIQPIVDANLPQVNTYGMTFGGGSLTDRDWAFIKSVIDQYTVRAILEFGAGLSTLLLNDLGITVLTFETNEGWINKINKINPKCAIQLWDGKHFESQFTGVDMAFVDGPAGDIGREESTRISAKVAQVVIVHDAGRKWARKYQDQYLKPNFDGPFKGGHRCHLWVKKGIKTPELVGCLVEGTIVENKPNLERLAATLGPAVESQCTHRTQEQAGSCSPKLIKIVSTARGWGGCARSVTTIMKMLIKAGHKVEFIPFRNAVTSSEWKAMLASELSDVKVTADYSTIAEQCDVLLMYADDYIWEFGKGFAGEEAFENIGADRKIMMLNYRRGGVGVVPWTRNWDKYMFLNSTQEKELLEVQPYGRFTTKVLPPCTDLEPFFNVQPMYEGLLRLVRHSSQGDTKFPKDFMEQSHYMYSKQRHELHLLPGPTFMNKGNYVFKYPRTAKPAVIADFLALGNCFWYSLPEGYMDMGPRVILEAMAAGLPILADNWGGAVDRVTPECGWLCNSKSEMANLLSTMTPEVLRRKGEAARERAYQEFRPEAWLKELLS